MARLRLSGMKSQFFQKENALLPIIAAVEKDKCGIFDVRAGAATSAFTFPAGMPTHPSR